MIEITNEDNMQLMARYPDNYFNLAIVDPPYGIGESGANNHKRTGGRAKARKYKPLLVMILVYQIKFILKNYLELVKTK